MPNHDHPNFITSSIISYILENERYHNNVSEALRYLMHDVNDISEGELSRRTGVPQPTIHRILSGATPHPRIKAIQALADFFYVTTDQLLARVPLSVDRIPGTFNPSPICNQSISVVTLDELAKNGLEYIYTLNSLQSRSRITTDIKLSGIGYAILLQSDSKFLLFQRDATIVVDYNRYPDSNSYIIILQNSIGSATIARFLSDKFIALGDTSNIVPLDDSIAILGVIVEVRLPLK